MNGKSVLETLSSINILFIGVLFGVAGTIVFSALFLLYRYILWLRGQDDWLKDLQSRQNQQDERDYPFIPDYSDHDQSHF